MLLQIITITNFEPEERVILKNIIETLGAKYTGYMTAHNSVIICKKWVDIWNIIFPFLC